LPAVARGADYYAAVDGRAAGDGSLASPGDLASALSGGGEMEFVSSDEKKTAANPVLYMVLVAALKRPSTR